MTTETTPLSEHVATMAAQLAELIDLTGRLVNLTGTIQTELGELRDDHHELALTVRRHQAKAVLRDVDDASPPSFR